MILLLLSFCFPLGERLEFTAKYGLLNIGTMVLEVADTATVQGRPCFRIVSVISSRPSLKFLFSLNDTIEVSTTQQYLLPLVYEEMLHEGKYRRHSMLIFNPDSQFVVYDDTHRLDLPRYCRDLLSFWYYLRTVPLVEGDTLLTNVHRSEQSYEVYCHVGKTEKVKTPYGEFPAVRVSPQTAGQGIFAKKGNMEIWYSDDDNRYPVQIKTRFNFGSITFKLKNVKT